MNIEESINKIKEVIYMSDGTKVDYIDINHMDLGGEVSVDVFIRAIETLLTAYEEEKEKNEELNRLKGFEMLDIFNMGKQSSRQRIEFDYVDKEKIKAGIEELKEDIKYSANPLSIDNSKFGIKVLQSLLEKE